MYTHPYVTLSRIRCLWNIFYDVLRDFVKERCAFWITTSLMSLIKVLQDALCLLWVGYEMDNRNDITYRVFCCAK